MDPLALAIYSFLLAIPPLIVGVVLVTKGKQIDENGNRNTGKLNAGWILILISGIQMGLSVIGAIIYSGLLFTIIFWLPLTVIAGLIATLSFGINFLTDGYSKNDKKKISTGWTLLIINSVVLTTIIVLLLMFMNGLIPIRFM